MAHTPPRPLPAPALLLLLLLLLLAAATPHTSAQSCPTGESPGLCCMQVPPAHARGEVTVTSGCGNQTGCHLQE